MAVPRLGAPRALDQFYGLYLQQPIHIPVARAALPLPRAGEVRRGRSTGGAAAPILWIHEREHQRVSDLVQSTDPPTCRYGVGASPLCEACKAARRAQYGG